VTLASEDGTERAVRVVVADPIDPQGLAPLAERAELVFSNGRGSEQLADLLFGARRGSPATCWPVPRASR
jgi:hypothetical protein